MRMIHLPLVAGLALMVTDSAFAAKIIPLQKNTLKDIESHFNIELPGNRKIKAVKLPNTLKYIQQHVDQNHITHIRMEQMYEGFPVFGGYAILHSPDAARSISTSQKIRMNGMVYGELDTELGKPPADFRNNAQKALEQLKSNYNGKTFEEAEASPIVFVDEDNKAHWAYQVSVKVIHTDKIPERPTAIIDALTLKPLIQWNDIKTLEKDRVSGMGFGGNTKTGEFAYGKNLPLLEIFRNPKTKKCFMENPDVRIVDMKHKEESKSKPMSFTCEKPLEETTDTFWTGYKSDGYDAFNGAFSPSNDALYAGHVIQYMYRDWYKTDALKNQDGSPMQLIMRVHFGKGYENAYWDGNSMTFGDGDDSMYPLVSLDVGAHEVSHGFTEQHSNLIYYGQSGGLNESFSDMAAIAALYYAGSPINWMIGSDIMKEDSGYESLRYMDVPSKDGNSIDSADQYYAGMDVHFSSGVFNRLFYLISTTEGWDPHKAFDIMIKANMDYWVPRSGFVDAGCGVLSATKDLGYSLDDVKKALTEVAVSYKTCGL